MLLGVALTSLSDNLPNLLAISGLERSGKGNGGIISSGLSLQILK
jgi:hypothetical protein